MKIKNKIKLNYILLILAAALILLSTVLIACSDDDVSDGTDTDTDTDTAAETEPLVPDNPDYDRDSESIITVDFSKKTGIPLFKRQNTFSVSYSFDDSGNQPLAEAAKTLKTLRSETMRVNLSLHNNSLGKRIGYGTPNKLTYDFSGLDLFSKTLFQNGTAPYFMYGYCPPALFQEVERASQDAPSDMEKWGEVCKAIAEHYANLGYPIAAHEIWNEPDLDNGDGTKRFFTGTWDEYIQMYDYGVRGIREADPDATVGGLSLAYINTFARTGNLEAFFEHVRDNDLPLDFVSWHNYGVSGYKTYLSTANEYLSMYGDTFATTQIHVNEFHVSNSFITEISNSADKVPLMFDAIDYFIAHPTVTSVNWATWRDEGVGLNMIDNETGKRFAVYHALSIYNDMPVDRVKLNTKDIVKGFASVDTDRAGVILYSRSVNEKEISIALDGLPFGVCDIKVYAIDANHSSYIDTKGSDELECIYSAEKQSTVNLRYDGTIAANGVIYIEIVKYGSDAEEAPVWSIPTDSETPVNANIATVTRREYYFHDRSKNYFSEFDLGTFTAYAGMGSNSTGVSMGSAVITNLPEKLSIGFEKWGTQKEQSDDAVIFFKIDYRNASGEVTKSIIYKLGDGNLPEIPWSDANGEVRTIEGDSVAENILSDAPSDFGGTVVITYGIKDMGKDSTVKFEISK